MIMLRYFHEAVEAEANGKKRIYGYLWLNCSTAVLFLWSGGGNWLKIIFTLLKAFKLIF